MDNLETFYERYSSAFDEFVSSTKCRLKENSVEYDNLLHTIEIKKDEYPHVREIIEDDKEIHLNEDEVRALIEIKNIQAQVEKLELKELFFAGGKELYLYFKRMGILKE